MIETTRTPAEAIAFDAAEWIASMAEHHVFRMTLTCPHCGTRWSMDITEHPARFEIPDRRRLGLAMLCGACEAQRITLYVVRDGKGKIEWAAPFLTETDIGTCWGRLKAVPRDGKSWITAEGLGPVDPSKRLRDDRKDVLSAILTRKVNDYRSERVTCLDASQLAAARLEWKVPQPPRKGAEEW